MIRRSGNRFADKIMRQINELARDRTQNRYPLLLIARYVTVAFHGLNEDVLTGTLLSMIRQSGLPKKLFRK